MKTQEYIDAQEAYINRLKCMRQREKENLSDVDFALFTSRFDQLIAKTETELMCSRLAHDAICNLRVVGFVPSSQSLFHYGSLCPGAYASIYDFQTVLQHYTIGPVSAVQHPETQPGQVFVNSVVISNDEGTFKQSPQFTAAYPSSE
jgi:hypothetical protein